MLALQNGELRAHAPVSQVMTDRLLTEVFGTPVQVTTVAGQLTALYCRGETHPIGR